MSPSIHPRTRIGTVHLTVSDLERALAFYQESLGLRADAREGTTARLGADGNDLLALTEVRGARKHPHTTGLYHFAILVPSRADLARVLRHFLARGTALQGMSDHGVSEAIYLADPDGNGIEVYRDRPRGEWPFADGKLAMTSDPIDVDALLADAGDQSGSWPGMPAGAVMGHIHLHVADLEASETFYVGALGFDLIAHYGRSAAFVSAGGYHHHIGFNLWAGVGVPPPPPGSVGLRHFEVRLPDRAAVEAVLARVRMAGIAVEARDDGALVRDPSANGIHLVVG